MSSSSFSLTCGGPPFQFSLPKCQGKPVDFVRILHSSVCSEESFELTRNLLRSRSNMSTRLSSIDSGLDEKLKSVNDYVEYILTFFNSLKNQPSVRLDGEMVFEWTGSFSTDKKISRFPDVIFDVMMALHTKALLHYSLGRQLLYSDPMNNIALAGQNFHSAAGVMDYLGTILLPQWLTTVKKPIEANTTLCRALADFFTSETQQMAVVRETQKGGALMPLTVRLCVSVIRTVDEGMDRFDAIPKEEINFGSDIPIFNRTFYAALAYFYAGEMARTKDDNVGIALGYYREALVRISDLSTGPKDKIAKFEKFCTTCPFIREGIRYLVDAITNAKAIASRDNDMIFFQPVPGHQDLPILPTGILVMAKKMYNPVYNENVIMFNYDAGRAIIPSGTKWVPPVAVMPAAPPSYDAAFNTNRVTSDIVDADHKYAMELQRKLNAGEKL